VQTSSSNQSPMWQREGASRSFKKLHRNFSYLEHVMLVMLSILPLPALQWSLTCLIGCIAAHTAPLDTPGEEGAALNFTPPALSSDRQFVHARSSITIAKFDCNVQDETEENHGAFP